MGDSRHPPVSIVGFLDVARQQVLQTLPSGFATMEFRSSAHKTPFTALLARGADRPLRGMLLDLSGLEPGRLEDVRFGSGAALP